MKFIIRDILGLVNFNLKTHYKILHIVGRLQKEEDLILERVALQLSLFTTFQIANQQEQHQWDLDIENFYI